MRHIVSGESEPGYLRIKAEDAMLGRHSPHRLLSMHDVKGREHACGRACINIQLCIHVRSPAVVVSRPTVLESVVRPRRRELVP